MYYNIFDYVMIFTEDTENIFFCIIIITCSKLQLHY